MDLNSSVDFQDLKKKWQTKHKEVKKDLFKKHGDAINKFYNTSKELAIGSLSGLLLLTAPSLPSLPPHADAIGSEKVASLSKNTFLINDLKNVLPDNVESLSSEEEEKVLEVLKRDIGVDVKAEINGIRLNRMYGYIGAEQHLARYPGDNMYSHFQNSEDSLKYWSSGMAPGLGAWGYFTSSHSQMTEQDVLREKYYIAVQTFLAPGFSQRTGEFIKFFKYRKMIVVNPQNGKAMAVVIGDAGPGKSTGKQLGGSPEVMKYLERVDGAQKGPVLYFFIDDPEDKIPLGPINY